MAPTFLPYVTEICYRDGLDFNGYITAFVFNIPITVWFLLAGVAFYSSDAYIQLLSSSYWLNLGITVIVQELTKSNAPHPSCNNQGYSLPSWQMMLAWHYIVMMLVHRVIFWRRLGFFDLFRGILVGVIVPVVLGVSGNYTAAQILFGVFGGAFIGGFVMTDVLTFWLERLAYVTQDSPILNHWGFRNGAPSFYVDKIESHPEDVQQQPDDGVSEIDSEASEIAGVEDLDAGYEEPVENDDSDDKRINDELPKRREFRAFPAQQESHFAENLILGDPFSSSGKTTPVQKQKKQQNISSRGLPIVSREKAQFSI